MPYLRIVIPLNSSQMVKKDGRRRIHTKTVRSMLHWSHYRFRQRLLYTAEQHGTRQRPRGDGGVHQQVVWGVRGTAPHAWEATSTSSCPDV